MKILLLGSQGQVGWELQRSLAAVGEVLAYSHRSAGDAPGGSLGVVPGDAPGDAPGGAPNDAAARRRIELADAAALRTLVQQCRPRLVVNAAAYSAVDAAEQDAAKAWAVNADAPGVLADAAQTVGAALVHFSTDYVFSGAGHRPHLEDAATGPLSVYGRSKLAGEEQVRARAQHHLILRTSWVHSARGANFLRSIWRQARQGAALQVVDDQVGAPTSAKWLADLVAHLLPRWLANAALAGTYHATAAGAVSRLEWAQHILRAAHESQTAQVGAGMDTDAGAVCNTTLHRRAPATLQALSSAEHRAQHPGSAIRPLNSRLDCTRLQRTFEIQTPPWQEGVNAVLAELLSQPPVAPIPLT